MKTKTDNKKRIEKIKELLRERKSLILEYNQLGDYEEKVKKIKEKYETNRNKN